MDYKQKTKPMSASLAYYFLGILLFLLTVVLWIMTIRNIITTGQNKNLILLIILTPIMGPLIYFQTNRARQSSGLCNNKAWATRTKRLFALVASSGTRLPLAAYLTINSNFAVWKQLSVEYDLQGTFISAIILVPSGTL